MTETASSNDEPTVTFQRIELDEETVVVLTRADNDRAWIQSDTLVAIEP